MCLSMKSMVPSRLGSADLLGDPPRSALVHFSRSSDNSRSISETTLSMRSRMLRDMFATGSFADGEDCRKCTCPRAARASCTGVGTVAAVGVCEVTL
eukprot:CAMPEP_0180794194 /NCGR_PEP_ID=MMETSP1038_2-20121128/55462_1 /TAXON_ID=632150 /ORGANISM="Azadinium spinosum, Strain 3D9" /LENGTH=96 /DNA_ID=CAMNT_0022832883 /DNA_START=92 /DNA_END=382 /DNA_ORIENTATION=-